MRIKKEYERAMEEFVSRERKLTPEYTGAIGGSWYKVYEPREDGTVGGTIGNAYTTNEITVEYDMEGELFQLEPYTRELFNKQIARLNLPAEYHHYKFTEFPTSIGTILTVTHKESGVEFDISDL